MFIYFYRNLLGIEGLKNRAVDTVKINRELAFFEVVVLFDITFSYILFKD